MEPLFAAVDLQLCWLLRDGGRYHIETSPLICSANQWNGFYMITAFVMKELKRGSNKCVFCEFWEFFKNNFFREHLRTTSVSEMSFFIVMRKSKGTKLFLARIMFSLVIRGFIVKFKYFSDPWNNQKCRCIFGWGEGSSSFIKDSNIESVFNKMLVGINRIYNKWI